MQSSLNNVYMWKEKYLKIRNFGPIKNGYSGNDGFMPFSKYVFFCGPQATGKSCVAKLFSTFSWLEKAMVKGEYEIDYVTDEFHLFCAFHQCRTISDLKQNCITKVQPSRCTISTEL